MAQKKYTLNQLFLIILAGSMQLVLLFCLCGCKTKEINKTVLGTANPYGYVALDLRPNAEKINVSSADYSTDIAFAYYLFSYGMSVSKKAPFMLGYCQCPMYFEVLKSYNTALLDIIMIKSQTEFYRIDYRLEDSMPLLNLMPALKDQLNRKLDMVITERQYHKVGMPKMKYEKSYVALVGDDGLPYSDWDGYVVKDEREPYPYRADDEGCIYLTAHTINMNTIKSAKVNVEPDSYTVELELDCANSETVENSIELVRKGAGDENASYNSIKISFKSYDNGYFNEFIVREDWSAKPLGLVNFVSGFEYEWHFSYSEKDCDMSALAF